MTPLVSRLNEFMTHCVNTDQFQVADLVGDARAEIEKLRETLVGAVDVIRTWHNMGLPEKGPGSASSMWDIYWRNAPEIRPIREALRAPNG